jgi:hypothetical protein
MATRLYFPASDASPLPSQAFDTSWTYTSEATRTKLNNTKGVSAITIGTQIGPWTSGQKALDRQLISTRMAAGNSFTFAGATMSGQLMVREYNNGDNASTIYFVVKIISEDGSTVRRTWRSSAGSSVAEFINNATHRNKTIAAGAVTDTTDYTTVLGDRLLVEIGYSDSSGATPEASAKWGENATDLPVNETQTTDGAGWFEFLNNITFAGESDNKEALPGTGVLTLVGFSPTVFASDLKNVLPANGVLALAGFAPSVTIGNNVLPALGEITLSGFEPTVAVTNNVNVSAGKGDLSVAGFAPSVSATDHKNLTPANGELTLNGFAPSVELPVMVVTDKGELLLTGFEPSVSVGDNREVTPGKGDLLLTGFSPSVNATDHKNVLPGLGQLSFVGYEPVVETPVNINTALGQLILNGFEPTVEASGGQDTVVTALTGELILVGHEPDVTATVSRGKMITQILYRGFNAKYLGMKNSR